MEADPVREHLETALRDSQQYFAGGRWFIAAVGAVAVLGGLLRELYWLALISLVFFGGLVWLMVHAQRRTQNNPLGRIILDEPERITRITHRKASSSSGSFATHWLVFATADTPRGLGLKFDEGVLDALAPFLARRFVNATIEIPGFDPSDARS